ncbi:hypothetical protein EDD18DRAFT_1334331 [Armillaria luteobubalina]|uniref:Uncharacterized protein n=1 Tax=Armillaria luteobubalina TaxID=153913 RepID=A0AA39PXL0_9AGAR|nr:hypothetical protein EDD18DRAFT_1334331 [Armillaria luteobubalina]
MVELYDSTTSLFKVFGSGTLTIGNGQEHYFFDLYNFAITHPNELSDNPSPRTFSDLYFEDFLSLFTAATPMSHAGRIWRAELRFNNVTFLGLFRVECTESQLRGIILSLPYLKGITASEISIPNYLERAGAIANLSNQHTPEEIRKGQTGAALQSLAVDFKNCCDGLLLCLFASRDSLVRTTALETIFAWASADEPFFCVMDIPLPPLRIPVDMPLLSIVCAIVLTEKYQTANSLEWFTATFNNVSHPTEIQSVQIGASVSIGATVSPSHELPQDDDIAIAKWSALDDALCRAEVCLGGLLIDVEQPADPLWTTHTNAVLQWLQERCLPKARKKYPSTGLYFPMPPKDAVITQDSAEEPQDADSDTDEKIEESDNGYFQGSSNQDLV